MKKKNENIGYINDFEITPDYIEIPKYIFDNRNLSFNAIGLFCYLYQRDSSFPDILSLPALSVELKEFNRDSYTSLKMALEELVFENFLSKENKNGINFFKLR